jgi:hypothetical protein
METMTRAGAHSQSLLELLNTIKTRLIMFSRTWLWKRVCNLCSSGHRHTFDVLVDLFVNDKLSIIQVFQDLSLPHCAALAWMANNDSADLQSSLSIVVRRHELQTTTRVDALLTVFKRLLLKN